MTRREVEARARELDAREMSPDEFNRVLRTMLADEIEIEARAALIRWFSRRYPTARERLAYARRKHEELVESPLRVGA